MLGYSNFTPTFYLIFHLINFIYSSQAKVNLELETTSLTSNLGDGLWLVNFYSPKLSQSPTLASSWSTLNTDLSNWASLNQIKLFEYNCDQNPLRCLELGVDQLPALILFKDGVQQPVECASVETKEGWVDCLNLYLTQFGLNLATPSKEGGLQLDEELVNDEEVTDEGEKFIDLIPLSNQNLDGKVVVLTADNFDQEVKLGPWFVKFFAPWCGHCQKLAPIWEDLANAMKGVVKVGQVDCTVDKALCDKLAVKGYPTLKIMKDGKAVEYTGERQLEAFTRTLLRKFGRKPVISPQEAVEEIRLEEVALVVYNPKLDASLAPILQVLTDVEVEVDAFFVKGYWPNREAYNLQNSPSLLMIKDAKVVEFTGSLANATELVAWVLTEQHPTVRTLDPNHLRKLLDLNEGLLVVKLGHGLTRARDAKSFRDFAEPILRRDPTPHLLYFGMLDADEAEIRQWFMLPERTPPCLKLVDLKSKKFYSTNAYGIHFEFNYEEIREAINAQRAGQLTGFALKFTTRSFLPIVLMLILPLGLFLGVVYLALAAEDPTDEKKSN